LLIIDPVFCAIDRLDQTRILDHVIIGERHLRHILRSYQQYYDDTRTHLSLAKDSPLTRSVQAGGRILPLPVLGGLHHHYVQI
jgi:hypothetical protein